MWTVQLVLLLLVTLSTPGRTQYVHGPSKQFQQLVDDHWQWRLADAPEFATLIGEFKYADRVEEYTLDVLDERQKKAADFVNRLDAIDVSRLGAADKVNYAVLGDILRTLLDGYKWRFYGPVNPVNFLEGAWTDPATAGQLGNIRTETDLVAFISRINGWEELAGNIITRMGKAIQEGTTNNWVSDAVAVDELTAMTSTDPMQFAWYKPFNETLDNMTIPEANKTLLRQEAKSAIEKYLSAYVNVTEFLSGEYKKNARPEWGVNSFPDGEAYYQACLKWHLSVDITPEQVHNKGLQEVDRINGEMQKVMERLGFSGTISEFFTMLRNESRFIINDPEEAIERFRSIIKDRIQPKLSKYFKNIPDKPVIVESMPYDGPGGTYAFGSPDGSRPGVFQVNVRRPHDNPTFSMVALTLHETDPGHHMQDIYAQAATSMPMFRRVVDDNKYFAAPYHFPFYTALGEGWALYAESLGEKEELDIYADDYELMGRYGSEIFRACRLVVDTGLHHYNWTREKAIEYMINYTSDSHQSLAIEIDRYITWPGQACAYKIGELKIRELRDEAELILGDDFDIRDFHSVILDNGAAPLAVIDDLVHAWIDEQKMGPDRRFMDLTGDYFNWRQEDNPLFSTDMGVYKHNDRVESFSYTSFKPRMEKASGLLRRLQAIDHSKLADKNVVSYKVLKHVLQTFVEGYKWRNYGASNPLNALARMYSAHHLVGRPPLDTQGDCLNYVRRLEQLPRMYDEMIELSRTAITNGLTMNRVSMKGVPAQLDRSIVDHALNSSLYTRLSDVVVNLDLFGGNSSWITSRAERAVDNVMRKLRDVRDFITNEYMPASRTGLGVGTLPDGRDYYRASLRWHTCSDVTPEDVHQKGRDEVQRIMGNMRTAMAKLEFPPDSSIQQAYQTMRNDTRYHLNTSEAILERFENILFNRIKPKIGDYFKDAPDLPLVVRTRPGRNGGNFPNIGGNYGAVAADGSHPGVVMASASPENNPTYAMPFLSLHVGIPGHHLELSYELGSDIPQWRTAYVWRDYPAPFFFPYFNSYTEGWAMYSEYLGEEMGIYHDPAELMGRYSHEMFRAARLVVDTGIHYYNWTSMQAVDYLLNHTTLSRDEADREITLYATNPGQVCGYKVGELKIKELRRKAETSLGTRFDIRDFHSAILHTGPVPLNVLEGVVDRWIRNHVMPHPSTPAPCPGTQGVRVAASGGVHIAVRAGMGVAWSVLLLTLVLL